MGKTVSFSQLVVVLLLSSCGADLLPVVVEDFNAKWHASSPSIDGPIEAVVPGNNITDLQLAGIIKHPFEATWKDSLEWIPESDWTYSCKFSLSAEQLIYPYANLIFEGVDTHAKIYLNGQKIIETDNMFRTYEASVRDKLNTGLNELKVEIRSPIQAGKELREQGALELPADNDVGTYTVSPYLRKAGVHFGWDFAPRMVRSGLWKPVKWRFYENAFIDGLTLTHESVGTDVQVEMKVAVKAEQDDKVQVRVRHKGDILDHKTVRLRSGLQTVPLSFEMNEVEKWFPRGYGNQALYDFRIELVKQGQLLDTCLRTIGFRTIELDQSEDHIGKRFAFKVNEQEVFAKGVNMVPPAILSGEDEDAAWLRCFQDVLDANMNMVRIWGGGVYPPESFLDACDQHGILIWQDLMFANTMVPGLERFRSTVREEVLQQAERIAKHPSLALWCGNNEIDVAWKNWGWQRKYELSKSDSVRMASDYAELFQQSIPRWIRERDASTDYVHTSPLSNWGNESGLRNGDLHYWGVFHGEEGMDSFATNVGRFVSEYGMQSYPSESSLRAWCDSAQYLRSMSFWTSRQKSYKRDAPLLDMIRARYWQPKTPSEFVELGQAVQKECYEEAIRAHRFAQEHCSGTLYWQLNDLWPGASWSTVEFDGKWKPAHYGVRDSYKSELIRTRQSDDSLYVDFLSENDLEGGTLNFELYHYSGYSLQSQSFDVTPGKALELPLWQFFTKAALNKQILFLEWVDAEGNVLANYTHLFVRPGNFGQMDANIQVRRLHLGNDMYEFRLSTDRPIWKVKVECFGFSPSDQYFSMIPGVDKILKIRRLEDGGGRISLLTSILRPNEGPLSRDRSVFSGLRPIQQ